jgi:uncharacterized protein (DUF2141 family)
MKIRWMVAVLCAALVSSATAVAGNSQTGTLRVEVEGLTSSRPVYFGLWNSKSGFLSSKPLKGAKKKVTHGKAVWVIKNLPYGTYALSGYQDLNGNEKLDSNTFGAPVEPVGVSNNAKGHFGPPAYKDAKINLEKPRMRVKFKLYCPMGCEGK